MKRKIRIKGKDKSMKGDWKREKIVKGKEEEIWKVLEMKKMLEKGKLRRKNMCGREIKGRERTKEKDKERKGIGIRQRLRRKREVKNITFWRKRIVRKKKIKGKKYCVEKK